MTHAYPTLAYSDLMLGRLDYVVRKCLRPCKKRPQRDADENSRYRQQHGKSHAREIPGPIKRVVKNAEIRPALSVDLVKPLPGIVHRRLSYLCPTTKARPIEIGRAHV